jgi:ketosteroid isomerase-like protein
VSATEELIERFYAAFNARDGEGMAVCYNPNVRFWDPVFEELRGDEPGAMWRMLTERASDLKVELLEHEADEQRGSARWRATYTFTQTGRSVINDVHASFRFENGLISDHRDEFNFYRWARQALGPAGLLLGWTPMLRAKVRGTAREGLAQYRRG